jgi:ribose transport system permease protein
MQAKHHGLSSGLAGYAGIGTVLLGIIIYFSIKSPAFLTTTNFIAIANQLPAAILVAVGMTYVLIVAGIDLSVGSLVGITSAVFALALSKFGLPLPLAVVAAMLTGLICGMINGAVIIRWSLPPFIVTLGMLEIARGATFSLTDTRTIYLGAKIGDLGSAGAGNLSYLFLISIAVVIVAQLVLTRTVFGRYMIAIGTNEEAVRLSGIKTWPTKLAVYAISGTLCAVAALADTARMASANPNAGTGYELEAIAAAVIGGTSLMGGRGSTMTTLLGVIIMALLSSGLSQVGAEEPTKRMITGSAIVLAVIMDYYRTRITASRSK